MAPHSHFLLCSTLCFLTIKIGAFANGNVVKYTQDVRIINGSVAGDQKEFAFQAALVKGNQHFCGGVILNLNHILTAAHCVIDNRRPSDIKIKVGGLKLNESSPGRRVKTIFVHPGFKYDTLEHDVAVLRIEPLNNWTATIRNISLARSSPVVGTKCTVAGWGATETSEIGSNSLKYTTVPIISKSRCIESYRSQIKKGMFCAGYLEGGSDACQGDSGGGIICNGEVSGIVSWGYNCGEKNYPGVYTDVSQYRDWIQSKSKSVKFTPLPYLVILMLMLLSK